MNTLHSLERIYDLESLSHQNDRYRRLIQNFKETYGCTPDFIARAPGRVNLIGEHVDYSGYSVFPMAIEQDIIMALCEGIDSMEVRVANTDGERYSPKIYNPERTSLTMLRDHDWGAYFLAGYLGAMEMVTKKSVKGLWILVDGTVPPASGLSSSSALVCCTLISILRAYNQNLDRHKMTELAIKCEKYVGIESGGMDQTISFMAEKGAAMLIHFDPLETISRPLPTGVDFLIANSLVESKKKLTAATNYNLRVIECRLAAKLLTKFFGQDPVNINTLKDFQRIQGFSLQECIDSVLSHLHEESYTIFEICQILEMDHSTFQRNFIQKYGFGENQGFQLFRRARHVFSEALRVERFSKLCDENSNSDFGRLEAMGNLLDESHLSLKEDFECSCPELDSIVAIAKRSGALGARLTGAGWGGCVVIMVKQENTLKVLESLESLYYSSRKSTNNLMNHVFITKPGCGASIMELNENRE